MPKKVTFTLDDSIVAERMYKDCAHRTTPHGLVIEKCVQEELRAFLAAFLEFVGCKECVFLRMDAFVSETHLDVIEINVELQDGWGVALNLLRAAGHSPSFNGAYLPTEIIDYDNGYHEEFDLAQREFGLFGHRMNVVHWRDRRGVIAKGEFDSKMFLARFAQVWKGERVRVPRMFFAEATAWEAIPEDVVFKFCHKYGKEARQAGFSVATRVQLGKGKHMRRCYNAGTAIAQERVTTLSLHDGSRAQAIILSSRDDLLAGYTQVAPSGEFIINDRTSVKGPLVFE